MRTLTALAVKNAKLGDKLGDGDGLRLDVDKHGNRSWVFRYTSPTTGKERYAGFGSANEVTLAEARDARDEARKLIRANIDPIEYRNTKRTEAKVEKSRRSMRRDLSPVAKLDGKTTSTANTMAKQPSRLRLSDHWPLGSCRRRYRGSPQSAASDMGCEERDRTAC